MEEKRLGANFCKGLTVGSRRFSYSYIFDNVLRMDK